MKKLIITAVITAISSLYFIVDAGKYLTFQGGGKPEKVALQEKSDAMRLGTDLVKIISENLPGTAKQMTESVKKVLKDPEKSLGSDLALPSAIKDIKEEARPEKIMEKASVLISEAVRSLKDIITKPIEEKIDQTFCSQK